MSRKYLHAAKCSQMSSPKAGQGSGGDRCTEAVAAMIDVTYTLGPKAKAATTPEAVEAIMYDLVGVFPGNAPGATVSHLENFGVAFPQWLKRWGYDKIIHLSNMHNPTFAQVKEVIDRQQIAIGGFNDYRQLRLANGGNPFAWNPATQAPAGHVLLVVGYDDNYSGGHPSVIVHDPLRGYDGQPVDYAFASFQRAGFSDLTEVVGAPLPYAFNSETQPAPAPDPAAELAALKIFVDAVEKWLIAAPKPPV